MTEKESLAYALSDKDIQYLLNGTKIWRYPELQGKSLNDIFDSLGRCIVLFLTENETTGHWIAIYKGFTNRKACIHYFDPYGLRIDGGRGWLTKKQLSSLGQSYPIITELLAQADVPVYYNTHKFQEMDDDIATCGRHCVCRLYFRKLTGREYLNMINDVGLNPDEFVCEFTNVLLEDDPTDEYVNEGSGYSVKRFRKGLEQL